jgi:hypothetical protein
MRVIDMAMNLFRKQNSRSSRNPEIITREFDNMYLYTGNANMLTH